MSRKLSESEKSFLRRLVGDTAPFRQEMEVQMENCTVEDRRGGEILEFYPLTSAMIDIGSTVLGGGSDYDIDGVPIIISLLQRDGYLWKLDISRADAEPVKGHIDYDRVRSLGFRQGVSLERP
jgi:hypothetical protein